MESGLNRRAFVARSLARTAAGAMAIAGSAGAAPTEGTAPPQAAGGALPQGKLGKLQISRLLLGGNLLTHFTHSRDLRYVYRLAARYNTDEKILETLALAEANGVNALVIHTVPKALAVLQKHRKERGGKIQWIICPANAHPDTKMDAYEQQVKRLVDDGTEAIYLWGVFSDRLAKQKKADVIGKAVEVAKAAGVPSGVGAHDLEVVKYCEENKITADFYVKTLHHHKYPSAKLNHDSMWCSNPEETIQVMASVTKPWFAYKVMAAGAIPPEDAFRYAFGNGADFVLAGMFDFEIEEDAAIAKRVLAGELPRKREWRA
jgi:hypothetical protein